MVVFVKTNEYNAKPGKIGTYEDSKSQEYQSAVQRAEMLLIRNNLPTVSNKCVNNFVAIKFD